MPLTIAVVIPTIGRLTLERSVASVASQTVRPTEILVVSNGRQPLDTERIIRMDHLVGTIDFRVISLPPLSGPSISRNIGAWKVTSEYVAFLDDDDEFTSVYLEKIRARIVSTNPDVLYGAKVWRNLDGSVRQAKRLNVIPQDEWFETFYRQDNHGVGGTNVVVKRTTFFRLGGFPFDLPSGEDRAFAMAALKAQCDVLYVDEAEVTCHDPDGYRARLRSDKWLTNLKLTRHYWDDVGWMARLRSVWRLVRSFH